MVKSQTDYSETVIYKLCCKEPTVKEIYIGHTTNFTQRKNTHKTCCCNENNKNHNRHVYKFIRDNGGWDNWSMVQLREHNLKNKREAESTEHWWIEHLAATLNTNKPYAMCKEEPQLYKHFWYEEKKDYVLEKAKEHYEENKDHKLEYQKLYAEENKDKIVTQQREYREKNKDILCEKKKVYRELHKDEAENTQKKWRETNKEKISKQKRLIIDCECGQKYTFGNKHRHIQGKAHTDYQNKLCGIVSTIKIEISEEERLSQLRQKQKEYREKNSDKIKNFKMQYNETHKELIREQGKKYYQTHKKEIIEQNKKYVEDNKYRVDKNKHEWYQKNKEKILESQKQVFMCECGSEIRTAGRTEHYRSVKHQNYMESIAQTNSEIS
jgi:hypothetical protein